MRTITLYTKAGCHLCDRAKEVIERCRPQAQFELREIDIAQDADLLSTYGNDIPVILLDGKEIARHFIRERDLLKLLQQP